MFIHKKLFFALFLAGSHSLMYSYSITVKNETPYAVKITMVYAGGSIICPNVELQVTKGETRTIESGACCTSSVTIVPLEGIVKGQSFTYDPPVTGFGIACRGFSFVIKQTADGKTFFGQTI